ncbi:hypothetical protein [Thiolapillus sp.]
MADQIKWQGGRPTMTFQQNHPWIRGLKGVVGVGVGVWDILKLVKEL